MILGNFGESMMEAGYSERSGYGTTPPWFGRSNSPLPIANTRLPTFQIGNRSAYARALDRNEQSRDSTSANIAAGAATKAILNRAQNAKYMAASGQFGVNRVLGPGAYSPGSAQSLAQRLTTRSISPVHAGPGFVPASPFVYGPKAGVGRAVPNFFRGVSAPISASIQSSPGKAAIRRGE